MLVALLFIGGKVGRLSPDGYAAERFPSCAAVGPVTMAADVLKRTPAKVERLQMECLAQAPPHTRRA